MYKTSKLFNHLDSFDKDSFDKMLDEMNRAFNFDYEHIQQGKKQIPDVATDDIGVIFLFKVPGFDKTNLNLEVNDGSLYISGKVDIAGKKRKISMVHKVSKIDYDLTKTAASVKNGLLTVSVPYRQIENENTSIIVEIH